jgi:hypothetical protein
MGEISRLIKDAFMTEREGLPVAGYVAQSDENIALVNTNKVLEEQVLRQIDAMTKAASEAGYDPRWIAIARTNIEQGFMALNRAVFRPKRVSIP